MQIRRARPSANAMAILSTGPQRLKKCSRCHREKPITEFGYAKYYLTVGAKDGLNVQCKRCRRLDMNQRRIAEKQRKEFERKPMTKAPRETPSEKVLRAIASGYRTREAIKSITKLNEDDVADLLAELAFDARVIRIKRLGEAREFHLRAA